MSDSQEKHSGIESSHCEEVQDILGYIPGWIIRSGISLIALIVLAFLAFAWIFRYPDLITAPIIVSNENPPVPVMARADGRIQKLYVSDGKRIEAGAALGVLENPADPEQSLDLEMRLSQLPADWSTRPEAVERTELPRQLNLGVVQASYEECRQVIEEYQHFRKLSHIRNSIDSLQQQKQTYEELIANLTIQQNNQQQELELSQNSVLRYEDLFKSGHISAQERDGTKALLLQKKNALEGGRVALVDAHLRVEQVESQITELSFQEKEQNQQFLTKIQRALRNLISQLAQWDQTYILRSPVAGIVSFTKFWSKNQQVRTGDLVLTVAPLDKGGLLGKAMLPQDGAGKVKAGQRVNLRFADFPYIEFGTVPGIVKGKSLASVEGYYSVDIDLPRGLRTNIGYEIPLSLQLQGLAEICTDDIRLLTRLLNPIQAIFNRHIKPN